MASVGLAGLVTSMQVATEFLQIIPERDKRRIRLIPIAVRSLNVFQIFLKRNERNIQPLHRLFGAEVCGQAP